MTVGSPFDKWVHRQLFRFDNYRLLVKNGTRWDPWKTNYPAHFVCFVKPFNTSLCKAKIKSGFQSGPRACGHQMEYLMRLLDHALKRPVCALFDSPFVLKCELVRNHLKRESHDFLSWGSNRGFRPLSAKIICFYLDFRQTGNSSVFQPYCHNPSQLQALCHS